MTRPIVLRIDAVPKNLARNKPFGSTFRRVNLVNPVKRSVSSAEMNARKNINYAVVDVGRRMAQEYIKTFEKLLRPGAHFNIGASGEASKSFAVEEATSANGITTVGIIETSDHNRFIREGTKSGETVSIQRISDWVRTKGIDIHEETEKRDPVTMKATRKVRNLGSSKGWKFNKVHPIMTFSDDEPETRASRPYQKFIGRRGQSRWEAILYKIAGAIKRQGTSMARRGDADSYAPTPAAEIANYGGSEGRFDYVTYLFDRRKQQAGTDEDAWGADLANLIEYVITDNLISALGSANMNTRGYGDK